MAESFPGYKRQLKDGKEILIECTCHKQWREAKDLVQALVKSSLPFSEFMLSYDPKKDYVGDKNIADKIAKISETLKNSIDTSYLVYFTGAPGTQKTIISWWLGIQLVQNQRDVRYISMQKLLEEIMVSFDDEQKIRKELYEKIPILIIDDSFSKQRVSLFKNKDYQLAPFNSLIRGRTHSCIPRHTIVISDAPIEHISTLGFGKDIEYFFSTTASVLVFPDEFHKIKSKFNPKDIFGKEDNT